MKHSERWLELSIKILTKKLKAAKVGRSKNHPEVVSAQKALDAVTTEYEELTSKENLLDFLSKL